MKYLIVVIALALVGCGFNAKILSESTNTIVVEADEFVKAIPVAEDACKRKGLRSRVIRATPNYIFECY